MHRIKLSVGLFIFIFIAACISCDLIAENDTRDTNDTTEIVPKDPNGPHFVDIDVRQCTWAIPCDEGIDMRNLQILHVVVDDNRAITVSGTHPWIDVSGTVGDCGKDVDGSDLCNDSTFVAEGTGVLNGEDHFAWLQGELSSKGYVLGIYGLIDLSIEYNMRTSVVSDTYKGLFLVGEDPEGLAPIIGLPEESDAEINWLKTNIDDFEHEIEVILGPGSVYDTVMEGSVNRDGSMKATGQRTINGTDFYSEIDAEAVLRTDVGVGFSGRLYWNEGTPDIQPEASSYYDIEMEKSWFPEFLLN